MVSTGKELSRAFWIMLRNVAFDVGSPPPERAAISIWRMRTAKSFPRLASAAPFLCLIECHFEWPDISSPSPTAQEELVHAHIACELGVKRSEQQGALAPEHGRIVIGRQHLDAGPDALDHG